MTKPTDFAYHLTTYLTTYLSGRKNYSINTIRSYRDAFKLLMRYCDERLRIPAEKVKIQTLTPEVISDFIDWLVDKRGNNIRTANQRLAAIHAFFNYLQDRDPIHLLRCHQILSVKLAKVAKPMVGYLSIPELEFIFAEIDESTRYGRRNSVLLRLLYDSAARVQELCDLRVRDIFLRDDPQALLAGKGNKDRYAPIVRDTADRVAAYISENKLDRPECRDMPLFFNQQRRKITRAGVAYILKKYANAARIKHPIVAPKVTPHVMRHSKAMHLCQAGIDIIYIRDILGHVDIATTETYARLNVESMRDALENAYPDLPSKGLPEWTADDSLMRMLNSL